MKVAIGFQDETYTKKPPRLVGGFSKNVESLAFLRIDKDKKWFLDIGLVTSILFSFGLDKSKVNGSDLRI